MNADQPTPSTAFRVLLLGDPASRPEGLERVLARQGYTVRETDDVSQEPAASAPPDLVVISEGQAGADLRDVLEAVGYAFGPSVPSIVVLQSESNESVVAALDGGAADVLRGPVHLPELLARIAALRRRNARTAHQESSPDASAVLSLFSQLATARRRGEMLQELAGGLADALRLDRCALIQAEPGDPQGRMLAVAPDPAERDTFVDLARYPEVQRALATGEPVFVSNASRDPLFDALRRRHGPGSELGRLGSLYAVPVACREGNQIVVHLKPGQHWREVPGEGGALAKAIDAAVRAAFDASAPESSRSGDPLEFADAAGLERRMREELARAQRYSLGFSVVLLNLDREEETKGHFAEVLRSTLRTPDFISRYGAAEFAAILPETSADGARVSVQRLRSRLEHQPRMGDRRLPLVSAGIAAYPHPAIETADDMMALMEAALLRATRSHGERIAIADPVAG